MSRACWRSMGRGRRFPRVSGDEPLDALAEVIEGTFSPRERG